MMHNLFFYSFNVNLYSLRKWLFITNFKAINVCNDDTVHSYLFSTITFSETLKAATIKAILCSAHPHPPDLCAIAMFLEQSDRNEVGYI